MLDYFRDNLAALDQNNVWRIVAGNTTITDPGNNEIVNVATTDISKMLSEFFNLS